MCALCGVDAEKENLALYGDGGNVVMLTHIQTFVIFHAILKFDQQNDR